MQCSFRGFRAWRRRLCVIGRPRKYSDELRRRAVDEVLERDRKLPEVAKQLGITTPETLRRWVVPARVDRGLVAGPTTAELAEIKALRREVPTSSARSRSSRRQPRILRRRPARGLDAARQGLAYARQHRMPYFEGFVARDAAGLEAAHGQPADALALFDSTIDLFHRAGYIPYLATTLASLAVFFDSGDGPEV
jgi:transposase